MRERASPESPRFKFCLKSKWLPCICRNPYRRELIWRYKWISKYCNGLKVLDIPCGMGWGTSMVRRTGLLVGVDKDINAIGEGKRRYKDSNCFLAGDMKSLGFQKASFDIIVCLEGIEHVSLEVGKSFLKETARVLKKEGLFFLSSPYCKTGKNSGNPFHVHEYKPEEIKSLLDKYFKVEEIIVREVDIMKVYYFLCRK